MNASLFTADHKTHIKIVVVPLVAAIVIAVAGIKAHVANTTPVSLPTAMNGLVFKQADCGVTPFLHGHAMSRCSERILF